MRSSLLSLLLAAAAACAEWPAPKSAMDAYEYVQKRRAEAEKLRERRDGSGVAILLDALAYLDQRIVQDLAAGNRYLDARRANIYYDLGEDYALQGKKREAIDWLRKFADLARDASAARFLERNRRLDGVRGEPGFQAVLDKLRQFERYWDSGSLNAPFAENLSDELKLAGLAKLWSEVKYNFAYPEKLVALDWDALYLQAIPKVLATKSTADYYNEMMRLCARLSDGHSNVYEPKQLDRLSKPPLRTGLVEGRVLILDAGSPTLERQGLATGVEIVEVDGAPVLEYARRDVEPYQSASTPQDREKRTYWYGFLRGPAAKPVHLKLRDAAGQEFERDVARQGYTDVRRTPPLEWRMLPDAKVAYVALNTFGSGEVVKLWKEAFPQISQAAGVVLDLRLNGGGSSNYGYDVLAMLIDRPIPTSRQLMRRYNPTDRARGALMDWIDVPAGDLPPAKGARYSGPVAVLIGAGSFSAAEDFLVAWKNSGRGKTIGEPSGGSTGQPLFFQLPGGGAGRVCTKRDTFPNGEEWVGKGIQPDILVRPSVADVRTGRDAALERAVEALKGAK